MKTALLIATAFLATAASTVHAGSLGNGSWSPSGCGSKPEVPVLDNSTIDTFNNSVTAINDWQQKSRTYLECLIKEANSDNKLIAETANKVQEQYREQLEKISAEAKAAGDAFKPAP